WKGIPVKVVFQIKNARETGAGEIRLAPGAVLTLLVDEIGNGLANRRIAGVRPCKQSDQSPGGLRRRTGALPFRRRRFVTGKRLPEAAVGLLHSAQPDHGALAIVARGQRNRFQCAQHPAGSVSVVDAPAAEPRTVAGLVLQQEFHGALNRRMVRWPAKPAKTFYDACGDVGGRGIDHRVVVREGNVAEELVVVIAVKCAPATVTVLHAEQPLNAAAN